MLDLPIDLGRLDRTLRRFPPDVRVAVEFRHDSWFVDEVRTLLAEHGAALCMADSPWRRTPVWRTADWGYLRLQGGRAWPPPCYGRRALVAWAERLAEQWGADADVYAFFNNDTRACALRDARVFAAAAERAGLHPTRVPKADEVRLG